MYNTETGWASFCWRQVRWKSLFSFWIVLGLKIFEELINSWKYFLTKTSKMHLTNHHYRKVAVQTQMQLDWLSTLSLENAKQL